MDLVRRNNDIREEDWIVFDIRPAQIQKPRYFIQIRDDKELAIVHFHFVTNRINLFLPTLACWKFRAIMLVISTTLMFKEV